MPARNRHGGLHRGTLFDTNIPATSIESDIFTDQEVLTTIAGDDLVLMLDVSEDPDVIKYMTRANFVDGLSGGTITITDNESTNENNLIAFVADAATSTGLHAMEMDGDFHYNPSTGRLSATQLAGTLQTASQTNITGIGTISTGTWEGTTIAVAQGGTGATSLNNLITMGTHTAGDYVTALTAGTGLTSTGATSGESISHSLSVDVSQTQITAVGTLATGTWEADTIAIAQGGTGATSLNDLITLSTHTTGNYVATLTGGTGIDSTAATSGEGTTHTLSVDLAEVGEVAIADGDYIAFMDTTDSSATKKEAIADVATLFAGTGLTAASSVLGVDASQTQITAVGTIATGTWSGTDVAVAAGGTGSSTASGARTNLGLGTAAVAATGISNTNVPVFTSGVADNDFLRVDGTNIEGRSAAEVLSDIGAGATAGSSSIVTVGTIGTGAWAATDVAVAHGGTGASTATAGFDALSPMSAEGDVIYGGSSGTVTRLGKGDNDQVLTLASGVPVWASVPAGAASSLDATSSGANLPVVRITNTHADATAGFVKFVKDPGSGQGADADILGTITWYGTDASNNAIEELARIESYIIEADHGSEAAGMKFYVAENDATMTAGLQILGQATDDGEIDVTIGAGAASTTTIAGTLTMGSTVAMTNAGLVSVANQSGITGVSTITSGTWAATDVAVLHGGTGASTATAGFDALSPMTTQGDILYGGSSGTVTRLARGSDNQTLMMNGTSPNWETVTAGATAGFAVAMAIAL